MRFPFDFFGLLNLLDNFFVVDNFVGKIIVVHCTHGVNRTGFMVCRYMMERLRLTADAAVASKNFFFNLKKMVKKGQINCVFK